MNIFVFIDAEMTGIKQLSNKLLEISVLLTSSSLEALGTYRSVIHISENELAYLLEDWSKETHTKTGLLSEVKESRKSPELIDQEVVEFIHNILGDDLHNHVLIPTGLSIQNDLRFLEKELPRFYSLLHYRIIEISGIVKLVELWRPEDYKDQPEELKPKHRSMPDVYSALNLLRFYRHRLFGEVPSVNAGGGGISMYPVSISQNHINGIMKESYVNSYCYPQPQYSNGHYSTSSYEKVPLYVPALSPSEIIDSSPFTEGTNLQNFSYFQPTLYPYYQTYPGYQY